MGEPRHARIAVRGASAQQLEHALAEACEVGALGGEHAEPALLWVYTRLPDAARVREAMLPVAGLTVGPAEALEERVWSEAWKEGIEAIVVSPRLAVRPGFRAVPPGFEGVALVIEPGQAFGTGGHASTRLALEVLAALPPVRIAGTRVLDVGCGSGVLALAALVLGAERAFACDIDPLATSAAREAAVANGLGARLALFTGSLDALGRHVEGGFGLIVANLLRSELTPLLPRLARLLRPAGCLVLSGLLAEERSVVEPLLAAEGLTVLGTRRSSDPAGACWVALEVGERPEVSS